MVKMIYIFSLLIAMVVLVAIISLLNGELDFLKTLFALPIIIVVVFLIRFFSK